MRPLSSCAWLLWAALVASAPGCGAGLIAAGIANDSGSSAPPPELNLTARLPLVPAADTQRTVVVANAQIPDASQVRVLLTHGPAAGPPLAVVEQAGVAVTPAGGSTTIRFTVETGPIRALFPDPTAQDVPATLSVLVADRPVAPVLPVTLLRQPVAQLRRQPGETVFLSAAGGTAVTFAVSGLQTPRAQDLAALVVTVDAADPARDIVRPCTGLVLGQDGGVTTLSATVPGSAFPGAARLLLVDPLAGQSTVVEDVWYRPDPVQALPARGPTTGGTIVTLTGTALVPLDFGVQPAVPDFARVELLFRKGGREVALPRDDLLTAESRLDRLVFRIPASPDGRPGRVSVVLRADLGGVTAEVVTSDVFLYANRDPVFGPRGALLDRQPVAVTPIALEGAPGGNQATDIAVLYAEGGVSSLQLLLAEENGMFIRLSGPRQIGEPLEPRERDPRDLCDLDFDFDGVPDLFAINYGGASARHHLVRGQPAPLPPLGSVGVMEADGSSVKCLPLALDPAPGGAARRGIVLVPDTEFATGQPTQVWVATQGGPGFERVADLALTQRHDAAAVFDVDADGKDDFVAAVGGVAPRVDIAFGDGAGGFGPYVTFDGLSVSGYTPSPESRVVGVHACGEPRTRSIAIVFAGAPSGTPAPTVAVLRRDEDARTFVHPIPAESVLTGSFGQIGTSLAANLDGLGVDELVLASRGSPTRLVVLAWDRQVQPPTFTLAQVGADGGWDELQNIAALRFGLAIPPPSTTRALFVLHDSDIDGQRERRLSTLLIGPGRIVNPPTLAGAPGVAVKAVSNGAFTDRSAAGGGRVQDIAFASANGLSVSTNGGFGGFFGGQLDLVQAGLLGETMTTVRPSIGAAERDALVVATFDGRILCWHPRGQLQGETSISTDLRLLSPDPTLHTTAVSPASRIEPADVDGDGIQDLVVLLRFATGQPAREGESLLLLLRGRTTTALAEFPFHDPVAAEMTHGNATGLAVADLVVDVTGPRRLEVAVAVPFGTSPTATDGDHVRFHRYVAGATPAQDRFARSFDPGRSQVLLAGNHPTLLRAGDFDRDGTQDLLVAAAADNTLRLFLNSGRTAAQTGEVAVDAFRESLASPRFLLPGAPRFLRLADIDGDANIDAIVVTETSTVPATTHVAFYISNGEGRLEAPIEVSPTRIGAGPDRVAIDLSDFNGDGVPDLLVGSDAGSGSASVRVLFGGSR